jgi:hypothetical protein
MSDPAESLQSILKGIRFLQVIEISRVSVIGAGSWGTALANLLAEKEGVDVDLWVERKKSILKYGKSIRINFFYQILDCQLPSKSRPHLKKLYIKKRWF